MTLMDKCQERKPRRHLQLFLFAKANSHAIVAPMAICKRCACQYLEMPEMYPDGGECYQHVEDNPKVILHSKEEMTRRQKNIFPKYFKPSATLRKD